MDILRSLAMLVLWALCILLTLTASHLFLGAIVNQLPICPFPHHKSIVKSRGGPKWKEKRYGWGKVEGK